MSELIILLQTSLEKGTFIELVIGVIFVVTVVTAGLVFLRPMVVYDNKRVFIKFGIKNNVGPNNVYKDGDGNPVYTITKTRRILLRREFRRIYHLIHVESLILLPLKQMEQAEVGLSIIERRVLSIFSSCYNLNTGNPNSTTVINKQEYKNYQALLMSSLSGSVKHSFRKDFIIGGIPKPGTEEFNSYCERKASRSYDESINFIGECFIPDVVGREQLLQAFTDANIYENTVVSAVRDIFRHGYDYDIEHRKIIENLEAELLEKEAVILFGGEDAIESTFASEDARIRRRGDR